MVRVLVFLLAWTAAAQPGPAELARRYFTEVWAEGKAEKARDYFAPRFQVSDPRGGPGAEQTVEQHVEMVRNLCAVNSDCAGTRVLSQISEGNAVATVWVLRAKPRTMFASLLARALGAGRVERRAITILRFDQGRVAEMTMQRDDLGIYADLGLINGGIVFLYALGGTCGLALAWVLRRGLRK